MSHRLHTVQLNLAPEQYLSGYAAAPGKLFLPVLSDARGGDRVAARVGILGQGICATVFGAVSLVRRFGRPALPPGVELALDPMSLPAARFLAQAARGEPCAFRERSPRWVVARPLRVRRGRGEEREVTTLNVSLGGCAVGWGGALPQVGEVLTVKLGEGFLAPAAQAAVCWSSRGDPLPPSLGLRVLAEGRAARAWAAMVEEAERSGAQAA